MLLGKCRSAAWKPRLAGALGRLVLPVVVVLPIGRHEDRPEHHDGGAGHQDRHRPAHHARPDPPVQMSFGVGSRVEHPEKAADGQGRRAQRHRCRDGEQHADRDCGPHGVEVVEARERQAVTRTGDRQTRADDDGRDTLVRDVEAVFPAFPGLSRLVIATHQENAVIRSRAQGQRDDDVHRERRESMYP